MGLTADDVTNAISAQNAQVASGSVGVEPSKPDQQISALVLVKGQFATPEEFGAIVLRANPDGSTVRLRDVARVEVGGLSYQFTTRRDGEPVAGLSVLLAPKANALATATAVKAKMEALSQFFPANIKYDISYDITPVVVASIKKVLTTLAEAVVLVFLVMLLFLQNIRYTIIPTVVVPVALLGTCGILLLLGFSINVLTLFGMVLAIGILVDDAIVVVENVERIMSEEGLSPRDATRKAMRQITGAIIGITLVLVSVFVPMAFFPGSVGIIYRQFSASMIAAIGLSSLLALSLTPALCATILKPVAAGHHHAARGPFGWFNRRIEEAKGGYAAWVRWSILRAGRLMLIYAGMLAAVAFAFIRLPGGFLPVDDQGFVTADVLTPPEASFPRTLDVVKRVEDYLTKREGIDTVTFLTGYSFLGQGQNTAQAFITLKDWSERRRSDSAGAIVPDINRTFAPLRDGRVSALQPPPIDNLGNSSGFSFRLQDRGQRGYVELMRAKDQLLAAAAQSPVLQDVYVEGLSPAPQVELVVDREKAAALGVTFEEINNAISTSLGSAYINDFPNRGRMQRVIVQADGNARMQADQILTYNVRKRAVSSCRCRPSRRCVGRSARHRSSASTTILRCGSRARPSPATPAATRSARWSRAPAEGLRLRMGGAVAARETVRLAGAVAADAVGVVGVPRPRRALRELDHPLVGPADRTARHIGRGGGGDAARAAERCLFHRRHRDHYRARRQGRHPDHRIRQSFARAGLLDQGRDYRSLPHALSAHCHDRPCVRLRRGADDHRGRRQRQKPTGAGNDRPGRDDRGGHPGTIDGSDFLRDGASLLQSRRQTGASIRHRGRCRWARRRADGERWTPIANQPRDVAALYRFKNCASMPRASVPRAARHSASYRSRPKIVDNV